MCFYSVSQFVDVEGLVNMVIYNIRISVVLNGIKCSKILALGLYMGIKVFKVGDIM